MDAKIVWLFVFVLLYWAYCIFWGVKGALTSRTASDYFIAGRGISIWVFVLAATATSFSGWTFMGHPGLIYRDGLPYAYASFYAITIPFTGVMFLKRQWMIGKRFGFVTPGEMLSDYFRSDSIRILVVIVALVFSVPYLGVQLRASGFLFNVLTDGMLDVNFGMWVLSAVVIIYVASGGLRAVAYVDTVQCLLLAGGIIAIGIIALVYVGGMGRMVDGIAALSQEDQRVGSEAVAALEERGLTYTQAQARLGAAAASPDDEALAAEAAELRPLVAAAKRVTPDGYSHYVAIPGVIQFVDAGGKAQGGAWTGIMVLAYMFALMGIQSAPAFTMWAFSNRSPKPFAPQQVWASSFGIGLILFAFTAIQGMGSHLLGTNLAFYKAHPDRVAESVTPVQANIVASTYRENVTQVLETADLTAIVTAALAAWRDGDAVPTFGDIAAGEGPAAEAAARLVAWHEGGTFDAAAAPALVDVMNSQGKQGMLVPQLINLIADVAPWLRRAAVGVRAGGDAVDGRGVHVHRRRHADARPAQALHPAGGDARAAEAVRPHRRHRHRRRGARRRHRVVGRAGAARRSRRRLRVPDVAGADRDLLVAVADPRRRHARPRRRPRRRHADRVDRPATRRHRVGPLAVTIHSAGWGILFNLGVAIVVSALTQNEADHDHKMVFHGFLREHAGLPESKRHLIPRAWAIALVWFLFAIGPGAVVGNTIFGAPNDPASWMFGIRPSGRGRSCGGRSASS